MYKKASHNNEGKQPFTGTKPNTLSTEVNHLYAEEYQTTKGVNILDTYVSAITKEVKLLQSQV